MIILLQDENVNNIRVFKKFVTKLHRYKHIIVEKIKNLISKHVELICNVTICNNLLIFNHIYY